MPGNMSCHNVTVCAVLFAPGSLVTKFDLVCSGAWKVQFANSVSGAWASNVSSLTSLVLQRSQQPHEAVTYCQDAMLDACAHWDA